MSPTAPAAHRCLRTLAVAGLLLAGLGGPGPAGAGAAAAATACPTPARTVRHEPAGTGKRVALTFDDGPSRFTPAVLQVLRRAHVHATFFVTGKHVQAFPAYVRDEAAAGNLVGNHTWHHPQAVRGSVPYGAFDTLATRVQRSEIGRTTRIIVATTGVRPCFFRAPGGHDTHALALIRGLGLTAVNWNQSLGDSGQPATTTPRATRRLFLAATHHPAAGVLLLAHDGKASAEPARLVSPNRGNTVAALPRIIAWYQRHGYRFVRPDGRPFADGQDVTVG